MDQKFPLPPGDAYQPQAPPPPYSPYSAAPTGSGAIGFDAMQQGPPMKEGPPMQYVPPVQHGPPPQYIPPVQHGPPPQYVPPVQHGPPPQYVPPVQHGPPMQYVPPMQPCPPIQQIAAPAVTVVHIPVSTHSVIGQPCLGAYSVRMVCPHCHVDMTTTLEKTPSASSWLASFLCCFFGFAFGCCLIPLCMDSCQQVEHRCTNCKSFLGKYSQY